MKKDPELRDQRIRDSKLGQGKSRDRELADAQDPHSKLRDGYHAAGKLPDGDYSFGWHWHTIRSVLETHVKKGQSEKCGLRSVLKSPSFPLVPCRVRRTANGTYGHLLRNGVSALPAGFH